MGRVIVVCDNNNHPGSVATICPNMPDQGYSDRQTSRGRKMRWFRFRYVHWFLVGFVAMLMVGAVTWSELAPDERNTSAKPLSPGSPAWLMQEHDCWNGDAPADMVGELPGHAVVTWPGDSLPTYGGAEAVGAALEQVFGDVKTPGLIVHGFCR